MDTKQSMEDYLVVFDLDGTLIDTDRSNNMAYKQAVFDVIHKQISLDGMRITRETIQPLLNIDEQTMFKIVTRKELLFSNYLHLTLPLPGLFLLRYLNGPRKVLLTNARRNRAEMVLRYYHVLALFDKRYYKEDYSGNSKFEYLLNSYNDNPNKIILFENDSNMIQDAIRKGFPKKNIFKT